MVGVRPGAAVSSARALHLCHHQQVSSASSSPRWRSRSLNPGVLPDRSTNLGIRGALLFSVGVFLALVLNLLQVQRNVTLFPPDVLSSIFSSAWWVPPCCGTASGRSQEPKCVPGVWVLPHLREGHVTVCPPQPSSGSCTPASTGVWANHTNSRGNGPA